MNILTIFKQLNSLHFSQSRTAVANCVHTTSHEYHITPALHKSVIVFFPMPLNVLSQEVKSVIAGQNSPTSEQTLQTKFDKINYFNIQLNFELLIQIYQIKNHFRPVSWWKSSIWVCCLFSSWWLLLDLPVLNE